MRAVPSGLPVSPGPPSAEMEQWGPPEGGGPAVSRSIPDPHRLAKLDAGKLDVWQAREGEPLLPSPGLRLLPSGLVPHLPKGELQVSSGAGVSCSGSGVEIPRSSLKRRSLPPGGRGGLGLEQLIAGKEGLRLS